MSNEFESMLNRLICEDESEMASSVFTVKITIKHGHNITTREAQQQFLEMLPDGNIGHDGIVLQDARIVGGLVNRDDVPIEPLDKERFTRI